MKTFKIKDLVVSVGDAAQLNPITQTLCRNPSFQCGGCSFHFTAGCPAHSLTNCQGCSMLRTPICPGFTVACLPNTFPGCIGASIGCQGTPIGCGGTDILFDTKETIRQFEHLKVDEIEVLKGELTKLQKAMETRFQPQNLEDLNELEIKLNEALKEVKVQKSNMK